MPDWPDPKIGQSALVIMILERVHPIAEYYGFEVVEITQDGIEAGSNPFFIKPVKRVFQPNIDDDAATAWWALTKYSYTAELDRENRHDRFNKTLLKQYRLYIDEHGPIGALLHMEECVLGKLNHSLSEDLFEIQRLCSRYVKQVIANKEQ